MKHQPAPLPTPPTDEAQRFSLIYQFYYQPLLLFIFLLGSWWTSKSGVLAMAEWISGASAETEQIALLVSAFCTGKTKIAEVISETISANAIRTKQIAQLSGDLDGIIFDRAKDIGERELSFLSLARQMDALLQELQNADRTRGLRAASEAMTDSVAELGNSTDSALGQAQAQAVAAIVQEERASGRAIAGLVEKIEALPVPEAGRASLLPAQVLVLKHWRLHLPQIALALAVDLFAPLSTMLFWAAAIKLRRRGAAFQEGDLK
ncbi:hypothetical protein [Salipiger thiooxidans]|uniref:hypothetical protein n=1 Tax=Salipiger thiooxidans TaxID=282683 RepID=UPI001CD247E4|nr:hypothetical protein [Salipiger thiooxidans]MCA0848110.1 hypothetical protein [Salipiger thiooxidans]